jgi:hypothetical protein
MYSGRTFTDTFSPVYVNYPSLPTKNRHQRRKDAKANRKKRYVFDVEARSEWENGPRILK